VTGKVIEVSAYLQHRSIPAVRDHNPVLMFNHAEGRTTSTKASAATISVIKHPHLTDLDESLSRLQKHIAHDRQILRSGRRTRRSIADLPRDAANDLRGCIFGALVGADAIGDDHCANVGRLIFDRRAGILIHRFQTPRCNGDQGLRFKRYFLLHFLLLSMVMGIE
jgi:hypothetical protein